MTASQFWGLVATLCFLSIPVALAHLHAPPEYKPLALLRGLMMRVGDRIEKRQARQDALPPPLPQPRFPGMPDRDPGERPATSKQCDYLRHLTGIDELELATLGKWQASWLIDSILQGRNSPPAKSSSYGCTVFLAIFTVWFVWKVIASLF